MMIQHPICPAQLKLRHLTSLNDPYLTASSFGNEPNDLSLRDAEVDFSELQEEPVGRRLKLPLPTQLAGKTIVRKSIPTLGSEVTQPKLSYQVLEPKEDSQDLVQRFPGRQLRMYLQVSKPHLEDQQASCIFQVSSFHSD